MHKQSLDQACDEGAPQQSVSSTTTGWAAPSAPGLQNRLQHRHVPSRLAVCSSPPSTNAPFNDVKTRKMDLHDPSSKSQLAPKLHVKVTCDGPPTPRPPQQSCSSTPWSQEPVYSNSLPMSTSASFSSDGGAGRLFFRTKIQAASWLNSLPSFGASSLLALWVICCIIIASSYAWNLSLEEFPLFGRKMPTALAWLMPLMVAIPMCLAVYHIVRADKNWAHHFDLPPMGATALLRLASIIFLCLIAAPAGILLSQPKHGDVATALQASLQLLSAQVPRSTGPPYGIATENGSSGPQTALFKATGAMEAVHLPYASHHLHSSFIPLQTSSHLTTDQQHQAYSAHSFPLPQTLHAHSHFHLNNAAAAEGLMGTDAPHQSAGHSSVSHSLTDIDQVYQSHSFPMSEASHAHNHFHHPRDVLGALSAHGHHNSPAQQHVLDHALGLIHAPWGSVMNTTLAVAHLARAAVDFGQGMTQADKATLLSLIRAGADYLMRCNLNVDNQDSPAFAVAGAPPSAHQGHKAPAADKPHIWLLTKDYVGADLLAGAAAALAASNLVFRDSDPDFAQQALHHATYLYKFASSDSDKPQSYCTFIPCPNDEHHARPSSMEPSKTDPQTPQQSQPQAQFQSSISQQAGISYSSLQYKIGVHRHSQQNSLFSHTMTPDAFSSYQMVPDEDLDPEQDSALDDMAWAAIWMYRATMDADYLFEAQDLSESYYQEYNPGKPYAPGSLALAVDLELSKIQYAAKVHQERLHAHFARELAQEQGIDKPNPNKLLAAFHAVAYAVSSPGKSSHPHFANQLCKAVEVIHLSAALNARPHVYIAHQDPWIVAGSFAALLNLHSDPVAALKACQEDAKEQDSMI